MVLVLLLVSEFYWKKGRNDRSPQLENRMHLFFIWCTINSVILSEHSNLASTNFLGNKKRLSILAYELYSLKISQHEHWTTTSTKKPNLKLFLEKQSFLSLKNSDWRLLFSLFLFFSRSFGMHFKSIFISTCHKFDVILFFSLFHFTIAQHKKNPYQMFIL